MSEQALNAGDEEKFIWKCILEYAVALPQRSEISLLGPPSGLLL